jgi:two-component system response regulator YesN
MSYKVIIADDELLILVGLQSMINWEKQGCEICALARNGEQLHNEIVSKNPDIVISDIKMPIYSGLEVLLKTHRENPEAPPVFILLTNFEDFSMAKQAIQGGALEYLVKMELTKETLIASIDKAKAKVEAFRKHNPSHLEENLIQKSFQDNFFVRLYNGLIPDEQTFTLQAQNLGITFEKGTYQLCYAELIGLQQNAMDKEKFYQLYNATTDLIKETHSLYCTFYLTSLDIKHIAILFYRDPGGKKQLEPTEIIRATSEIIQRYFSVDLYCGISIPIEFPHQLASSFQQAKQAQSKSGKECKIVKAIEFQEKLNIQTYLRKFSQAFSNMDLKGLEETFDEISELLQSRELSIVNAIDMLTNILYLCISFLPNGEEEIENMFPGTESYRVIYRATNTNECISWINTLKKGVLSYLRNSMQDYKAVAIENVKKYIETNANKKLKLSEIASIFGFSPNYLSTLFSNYTKTNLIDYINQTKIKRAKERLLSKDLKIYELAAELGFESPFYFSKVFKKIEGVSPREYYQAHQPATQITNKGNSGE